MITAIQASIITPTKHSLIYTRKTLSITTNSPSFLCLCKSNSDDSDSDADKNPAPDGDARSQELLAKIAMIQTQKVRLTDYLDERAEYLTKFAEEANQEFDKVGQDALKDLDEASERIMENIEARMQAFEESTEMNKEEIEQNENKLAEFEDQIERDRNEGLFFKNLGQTTTKQEKKSDAKEESVIITKESVGSKTKRNIYLGLIGLLVIGIADSFLSSPDWRTVALLGAVLAVLFFQVVSLQTLISNSEERKRKRK